MGPADAGANPAARGGKHARSSSFRTAGARKSGCFANQSSPVAVVQSKWEARCIVAAMEVGELIRLQQAAYGLLLEIDRRSAADPQWLAPATREAIRQPQRCLAWLEEREFALPVFRQLDQRLRPAFASLFASFFCVSFEVEDVALGGQLLAARVGLRRRPPKFGTIRSLVMRGVRHDLSRTGIKISPEQARQLVEAPLLKTDVRVLAYIWELGRRAAGRSKGAEVHALWRSLPLETRKTLDESRVDMARTAVIARLKTET